MIVAEAERRLKELEEEKRKLDAELKAAQDKISKTENTAYALQVQLRVSHIFPSLTFVKNYKSEMVH